MLKKWLTNLLDFDEQAQPATRFTLYDSEPVEQPTTARPGSDTDPELADRLLTDLKKTFLYGKNVDFKIDTIKVDSHDGLIIYLNSLIDLKELQKSVLNPLLKLHKYEGNLPDLLPNLEIEQVEEDAEQVEEWLTRGGVLLIVDGFEENWILAVPQSVHRAIDKPISESVVRGPHEGFIEDHQTNFSLIRKYLPSTQLVSEELQVGKRSKTICSLLYLNGICNPNLVDEVRRRVEQIDIDMVVDSGTLEQLIEDHKFSFFPTIMPTELPDRAAYYLSEGYAVLLVGHSPFVLIMPVTFFSLLQSPEDRYLRWQFGTLIRLIRYLAMLSACFLPATYLAATTFHPEMIPTDLLVAFTSARENLPFPSLIEVLIMEVSFELIREAGIRVPTVIGPTIGIVGALILGQAAVQANIISPILVIIVSITGLGSFAIPTIEINYAIRATRFVFIFLAAIFGFFGMALGIAWGITYLVSMKSFGVPYFAPIAPHWKKSKDTIIAQPIWKQVFRPPFVRPVDPIRMRTKKMKKKD